MLAQEIEPSARTLRANVLVVDDDLHVRDLMCEWLEEAGGRCAAAGSAAEAVDTVQHKPVDVAVLDLRLPGENGLALARRLRQGDPDMALIMVTGAQSFDAAVEGMRLGVLDYLLKPFDGAQLVEAVDRGIRWRQATRRTRLERQRFQNEIERRSAELSETFAELQAVSAGAIEALLVTLGTRSREASDHAKRTAQLAVSLALAMGLPESAVSDIERGALLHDIGKVALPDAFVHKGGPLSDEEIAVVRTHPQIGADILAAVPSLRSAAEIVLSSHEWYDGSGYPRGLAGQMIPIGARITALADAFDVLTHGRIYRDPISNARAAGELVRGAGTQFDPDVVHVWLRLADACGMLA